MKVLIVEDDEFKQKRIAQAVRGFDPKVEIIFSRGVNSGLDAISVQVPDLILLDMSLTTFDVGPNELGGRPQNFGGMEVLRQMDRLDIVIPVIVITQHERFATNGREVHLAALRKELEDEHDRVFRGLIYYNSASGKWERQLRTHLLQIARGRGGISAGKSTRRRR